MLNPSIESYTRVEETLKIIPTLDNGLSFKSTYLSLVKAMIGTGILYFPKSFYLGGTIYSSILCVIVAFLSYKCMVWLSKVHDSHPGTYAELAGKALGRSGSIMVDIMVLGTQIGPALVGVGFLLENSQKSLKTLGLSVELYILAIIFYFFLSTLTLFKTLKDQTWAFIISDIVIVLNAIIIGLYSSCTSGDSKNFTLIKPDSMIYSLGVTVYGFEGIGLILPIKSEMNPEVNYEKVLALMMTTITIIILWFANINVYAYGDNLDDVVTLNLPNETWVAIMILGYVGAIVLSIPLVVYPAYKIIGRNLGLNPKQIVGMKIILMSSIVFLGFIARDYLGLCVSIFGGIFCAPLAFIMPALLRLKLNIKNQREKWECYFMIGLGIGFGMAASATPFLE